jgi:hypothetical protein
MENESGSGTLIACRYSDHHTLIYIVIGIKIKISSKGGRNSYESKDGGFS